MNQFTEFLIKHGYWVLFVSVVCRQACLPVPTNLLLLAAGALAGLGRVNPFIIAIYAISAFILSDFAWYEAGRRWGTKTLNIFCRTAQSPHSCVEGMVDKFNRYGVRSLLVSKFIIGLDSVTSPLSGVSRVRRSKFILFDGLGATLWVLLHLAVGYAFRYQLDRVATYFAEFGKVIAGAGIALLLAFLVRRLIHWYHFLREFRLTQISPDRLRSKLRQGNPVLLLDLQGDDKSNQKPDAIPGAVRLDPRQLERYISQYRHANLRTDREVILYSLSSGDSVGARVALALQRLGFERVRPLAGGFLAWRDQGFPVTTEVQVLPAAEHGEFVLAEVLLHSSKTAAQLLNKDSAEVNRVLERIRARVRQSQSTFMALLREDVTQEAHEVG